MFGKVDLQFFVEKYKKKEKKIPEQMNELNTEWRKWSQTYVCNVKNTSYKTKHELKAMKTCKNSFIKKIRSDLSAEKH